MKKSLLIAGLAAMTVLGSIASTATTFAKVPTTTFDFEAHRGGRDARPENTLYSYTYALENGANIEMDMQLTKDNKIVMSHNPILNPIVTRDEHGNYLDKSTHYDLRTMTVPEIKKFNVGAINPEAGEYYDLHGKTQITHDAKIPTLDEVFKLVKDSSNKTAILNIETKSYPDPEAEGYQNNADPVKFVKVFNDYVKKYGMENRVMLQSFDWRTLQEMHKLNPNITLVALWSQQPSWGRDSENLRPFEQEKSPWLGGLDIKDFKGDPIQAAHSIGADVISPYYMELSKDNVEEAHKLGMKVVPWTVNDPTDINMLLDMGVDGIISDKPWVLRAVLEQRNIKLNPKMMNWKSPYHLDKDHHEVNTTKQVGGNDASY